MAITKLPFPTASTPNYTPSISTDYNNQNEYIERNARGYNAITLTNWDLSTTKPQIAAGSVIEINGSTYDITTATDISTSAATAGTVYVYFDDGTPEFKFLDIAPTWSATLNGWYNSGDRFTGHQMEWNGASTYTLKATSIGNAKNSNNLLTTPDGISMSKDSMTGVYGTYTFVGSDDIWLIPKGGYMMIIPYNISLLWSIYTGSAWSTTSSSEGIIFIISDGTNYRLTDVGAPSSVIHYRKLW